MDSTETAYPNREHENADKAAKRRAHTALDAIAEEVVMLRRRLANPAAELDGSETFTLIMHVRTLTENLAILGALREVREWHAADLAEEPQQ